MTHTTHNATIDNAYIVARDANNANVTHQTMRDAMFNVTRENMLNATRNAMRDAMRMCNTLHKNAYSHDDTCDTICDASYDAMRDAFKCAFVDALNDAFNDDTCNAMFDDVIASMR